MRVLFAGFGTFQFPFTLARLHLLASSVLIRVIKMDSDIISESGSSSPEPSVASAATATSKSSRTRGPAAHSTWAHARRATTDEAGFSGRHRLWYCIHCPQDSPYQTWVSTNFRTHLRSKHQIDVEKGSSPLRSEINEKFQQLYKQASAEGGTDEIDMEVLGRILNQEIIDEALVSLIVVRNLPYQLVEWPEFHVLLLAANPKMKDYLYTAHSTIPILIGKAWESYRDRIRAKLQSALSSIHLSLDVWTSPNSLLLLGVCTHFVDQPQGKLRKALIALQPIADHSGSEQFATLLPVLEDYGIVRQLGCVVGDNASTNDTLCRAISEHLQETEEIKWDPEIRRLRCIGHIINLAVQAFLFQDKITTDKLESFDQGEKTGNSMDVKKQRATFRALGPLGKLHNITVHIRGSAGRISYFKNLARRIIPLDNRTRWNSWYEMVAVALELEGAVDAYTKHYFADLQADFLGPGDWRYLCTMKKILRPFARATLMTEGDNATIDRVLYTMDLLIQCFDIALVSTCICLSSLGRVFANSY